MLNKSYIAQFILDMKSPRIVKCCQSILKYMSPSLFKVKYKLLFE